MGRAAKMADDQYQGEVQPRCTEARHEQRWPKTSCSQERPKAL
jgi:hypothetical protein